ncbi:MAG: tetratricopeptide repeat protein [Candidatus Brocadia sp.]|uniref:PDZ domain-containing protein n=1 Tax=Candidatus Brocadia fulgida TaxID=380242 RepID=A0A0M2UZL4_9BACT|nr:MAG: hypothetical protein BROFUL_01326 [Candidatus Brocadia fulgida]UJS21256.1 MAG: tetratricopeptide repeat protein [Candidatus Brocadia sp.]
MNRKKLLSLALAIFMTGCSSSQYLKKMSPFKKEEASLEPGKGSQPADAQKKDDLFVCAGDIDVTYKKLGEVSLGEYGFSGHDVLAIKIREKARAVGAEAVVNVQYDTGASKTWQGYGELGGTDYGVRYTSWCKGMAIQFMESHNSLGLLSSNLTPENKEWFGLKKAQQGVIVVHVQPGSVASAAGIKPEDLIVEWNGEKIENRNHLKKLMERTAGKEARLILLRAKEIKTVALSVPLITHRPVASPAPQLPATETRTETVVSETSHDAPHDTKSTNTPEVHNEIGDLYLRKGMYDDAIGEYQKAIASDPNSAISYFNLSLAYDKKGLKREAEEAYATYKKLKPKRK